MMKTVYLALALTFLFCSASVSVSGQLLLNEVSVNPAATDNPCEYLELRGQPNAIVENVYFSSIEGDSNSNPGNVSEIVGFGSPGPALGSSGLLVVVGTQQCGTRTYPAGTTVIQNARFDVNPGVLQNGTNSFLLISSPTPITNMDYDADNNGTLELLPAGAVILDSVAWSDGGTTDTTYGTVLTANTPTIGAATRFPNNTNANSAPAWYAGAMTGTNDSTTYSPTIRTLNFPADGVLTPGAANVGIAVRDVPVDVNGDGFTDYTVVRAAGGAGSQLTWYSSVNGGSPTAPRQWGVSGDQIISGDFDGDGADDEAVYRGSNGTFYIIQSATTTIRTDQFGQAGDDARVSADYNGDGRDDLALYRSGAQSVWYYKTSPTVLFTAVGWGQTGDTPAPGDYDGDGMNDFVVRRAEAGAGRFHARFADGTIDSKLFGLPTDRIVPGDYDGDDHTDLAVLRTNTDGFYVWEFLSTETDTVVSDTWGVQASGDVIAQGDYDGDGHTDYAVWRPGSPGRFYIMTVGVRAIFSKDWGETGDVPAANYNTFSTP